MKSELIDTLAQSQMFEEYEEAYNEATGMPMALSPAESWQPPLRGKRLENRFCALMAAKSRTCAACLQAQDKWRTNAKHEPATLTCIYGICEAAVPVRVADQTIGFLQTGQVMRQKPTMAQLNRVAKHLKKSGINGEMDEAKEAYLQTPVIPKKKFASATRLLAFFADHLSMKANQITLTQTIVEPPAVAKARQFIQQNYAESLTLGKVAAAVHSSAFYFCKIFKKATGLNFTEFVCRTRIEKAKNLLLNPNLRVSEIAYEVGFESLTHFNRTFKKIMSQSPTKYRAQLRAC